MYRFIHRVNSAFAKPFIRRRCLATEHSSRRKVLPPELSKDVVRLTCDSRAKGGICNVYLVGVIHDSPKSCQDVKNVINLLKPQVVFLELCSSRAQICYHYPVVISKSKRDVSEFLVAYHEAKKYGAKVILGDRPIEITKKRYKGKYFSMPIWQIIEMRLSPLRCPEESQLYDEIYVDERDQYMSTGILEVAREHNVVVAVVGKYHLLGIQKYWKQRIEILEAIFWPVNMSTTYLHMKRKITETQFMSQASRLWNDEELKWVW